MSSEPTARVLLADGAVAAVRALGPPDTATVLALHERLSEHDRYLRFFGTGASRDDALAAKIATETGERHAAVGCFLRDELVGVAHYEVLDDSAYAEIALVVDASVQAHGVATQLLEHLVSIGRQHHLRVFVAEVLAENSAMLRVLADLGLPYELDRDGPEVLATVRLNPDDRYRRAVTGRDRAAEEASLAHVLRPASVAVIGAGRRESSVGHAVLANLLRSGDHARVAVVNPRTDQVLGVPSARSVTALADPPELAVICLPPPEAADAVEECGRSGVRAVVVISSGITGTPHEERMRRSIRRYGLRMVGPNCLGVASTEPGQELDATFLAGPVPAGRVGVVTQSGGVAIALAGALASLGLGISSVVSTGDKYDVSGNDLLAWWGNDRRTEIAVLYLESFGNPRRFTRLARALARTKPVVAVRVGTGETARSAAASHTAAAATPVVLREALYEQAGVIAVDSLSAVADVVAALSWQPLPGGSKVAVISNAGGAGVLAADACERDGLVLTPLSRGTADRLRAVLPSQASVSNPVDTTAAVPAIIFSEALRILLGDEGVDAVLVITVPTAVGDPQGALAPLLDRAAKTVLLVRPGQVERVKPVDYAPGRPATASYADVVDAAAVLAALSRYARWRHRPAGPTPETLDTAALRTVADLIPADANWLSPQQCEEVLKVAGFPVTASRYASTEDDAVAALETFGGPVVLKADAEGVLHKSASGAVVLGLPDADAVRGAHRELRARFGSRLRGVLVQPMAPPGRDLVLGIRSDAVFGPLVVFGLGGTDTDLVADHSARLAPVTATDADLMLDGLRSSDALWATGIDRAAVHDLLVRLGALAVLLPEIAELDLNPVRVAANGCVALDIRIRWERCAPADPLLRTLTP
ncbi:bifunctional acetate--CoA ligase family protein/GNAT family N-acetyltransferase [Amycolatopsis sp. CA-230715]|uniref:bifunctional acetate--CoA ligase family protein/GNAT family N-acetyltransferase n=1 Tax=Amycolatopsis sp. CA-230715 TaxID=2745196 RepID=UPI001C0212A2|nr:bifunctional GNAT family N-acetyltransferase/acetate--CoA ligase family protein [Amycolatopsis sp. CA-230715]QWF77989.1 hypothetical protein HUW46_01382 [Amycolatopsis sp. CA-230715]